MQLLQFVYENAWFYVLVLSCFALLVVLWRLWRGRKRKFRLEQDKTGFYRYHKDSVFKKKDAYRAVLGPDGKKSRKAAEDRKAVAVISFRGDLRAKEHLALADLVDELQVNKDKISEVVVCVTSPGGMVAPYGHAFSEMERIRALGFDLTVCVDVVAASGGYLMSLPAHKIIAAPFAVVGSIGVMAFVPNLRKLLLNNDINPRTFTAGRFKRTVSLTDDAGPEEIARFQQQLDTIHAQFSQAVKKYRPKVDADNVTTGEHWTAQEALDKNLGLVDEIGTSHQYLLRKNEDQDLLFLTRKTHFWEDGLSLFASILADALEARLSRNGVY